MNENIDVEHAEYSRAIGRWEFIADAIEGEQSIKEKGETYLPKTPGMLSQDASASLLPGAGSDGLALTRAARSRYENYKLRAEFPEKVGTAIDTAVGLFTYKDAAVEIPPRWDGVLENVTPEADTIWDFHRIVSQKVIAKGRAGLWADVRENGLPYWIAFDAREIIDWSETTLGNERVLDRVVTKIEDIRMVVITDARLEESGVVLRRFIKKRNAEKDEWVEIEVQQPRTRRTDMGAAIADERGGVAGFRLKRIPFQFINADGLKPRVGRIPFLPLAAQCLKVYRMDANYQEALSFYEPTPFISGLTHEWIEQGHAPEFYGAGVIWHGPLGSDAKMVEYSGPSIENMRIGINDALSRADELSMRPFEPKIVAVESGESKRERARSQTSAARIIAQNIGAGIQKIMRISAEWLGEDREKVVFEPCFDFIDAAMDSQTAQALLAIQQGGGISKKTLHENYQRGGITEKSFDEEQELIGKGE